MAATLVVGKLEEFDPANDSITAYVERAQLFIEANGIPAEKKVAVFLSAIGSKTYSLLRNLLAPTPPKDKDFDELVSTLKGHFEPKPLIIAERFNFHRRQQAKGESVAEYISELRKLTLHCEFGSYLNEALRDRFVCGLRSEATQKKLLAEAELTLQKAVKIAQSMEMAAAKARQLQSPNSATESSLEVGKLFVASPRQEGGTSCYRCGKRDHRAAQCPFRSACCHNCGKRGHIKPVCRQVKKTFKPSTQKGKDPSSRSIKTVQEESDLKDPSELLNHVGVHTSRPIVLELKLNGKQLNMELDTGAAVSLVSEQTYRSQLQGCLLKPSEVQLLTYCGGPISVLGEVEVSVSYEQQQAHLPLVVVKGNGPSLFGRNWLHTIRLNWESINNVREGALSKVLARHQAVFKEGLGKLKGYEAKIHVDPEATPRFCKARPVPYSLRGKVEEELERLEKEGIIEPVQFAEWAAPVVPVLKSDKKSLRLCGDFKQTVNRASKLDKYPIPKIEDLFARLAGGKAFTKLDMSQAYQQLVLEEESRKFVVINTHRGLFRFNRLPFGVSSAPAIFQRVMESILNGISGVVVYLDDILITGPTEEAHLATLEEVLRRLEEAGLRLRRDKCVFLAPSVVYLGHVIDSQGLHPTKEKVRAVQEAPRPENVAELKSYLGLLTYYSKFLPNLSSVLAPLYQLLKHKQPWCWTKKQSESFEKSKQLLVSSQVLVHFDPRLEIRVACDASAYGLGSVLSHRMPDGSEKTVAFMSRTLNEAEKYSQIEHEALACVVGVSRFHSYLWGHHFTLLTDHKPLVTLQ